MTHDQKSAGGLAANDTAAKTVPHALPLPPVDSESAYAPNLTLGRSGYVPPTSDRLAESIRQLDALLCLVTTTFDFHTGGDDKPLTPFQNLNNTIQATVLDLASGLATQVHELHEQLQREEASMSPAVHAGGLQ